MKDKELRKKVGEVHYYGGSLVGNGLALDVAGLKLRVSSLEGNYIKDCPKCQHPVLAQYRDIGRTSTVTSYLDGRSPEYYVCEKRVTFEEYTKVEANCCFYQCLTCGSKFTCSEKCVCELLEG